MDWPRRKDTMIKWLAKKEAELTDEQVEKIAKALMWAGDFIGAAMCFAIPAMIGILCMLLAD